MYKFLKKIEECTFLFMPIIIIGCLAFGLIWWVVTASNASALETIEHAKPDSRYGHELYEVDGHVFIIFSNKFRPDTAHFVIRHPMCEDGTIKDYREAQGE